MSEILELRALRSLVKHSSLQKAAAELALSLPEVESLLAHLEQRLGVQLLQHEGGRTQLTDAGVTFHRSTARVLDELADAEAAFGHVRVQPSGKVRISAPVVLGQQALLPLVRELNTLFPSLAIDLSLVDRYVDLIHEEVDLAIRVGGPTDPRVTAERLCTNRRLLVASPRYLADRGTPTKPEELSQHDCILFSAFSNPNEWRLQGPDGVETVSVSGLLSTNNGAVLTALAEQGLGISFSPTLSLLPFLLDGRLVRVLPDHEMEETSVFAIYPHCDRLPTNISVVIDYLKTKLSDPPSWDQQLSGRVLGFSATPDVRQV
jgi:DNA-binding transcriptional LysR family regulator